LWTNACCSHPNPGESTESAASRRLQEELGFSTPINKAFHFTYKAPFDNGLTEFEFDHVFIGSYDGDFDVNPEEVAAYKFTDVDLIEEDIKNNPASYTAWFLIAFPLLRSWMQQHNVVHA
jgi:isopentenyl-diphosphate delta-isomerase